MPNINYRITDLPAVASASNIATSDVLPIVDISEDTTKKITAQQLANYVTSTIVFPPETPLSVATSVGDVLSVSNHQISADDPAGTDDRIIFWDDSAGKLTHLSVGTALSIAGTQLNCTALTSETPITIGTTAADVLGSSGHTITADDPGADRIIFWDDSETKLRHLSVGEGLEISGTTLKVTSSGGSGGSGAETLPADPPNSVQFNNTGAFGGSSNFTWDGSLNVTGNTTLFTSIEDPPSSTLFKRSLISLEPSTSIIKNEIEFGSTIINTSSISLEQNKIRLEASSSTIPNSISIYMNNSGLLSNFIRLDTKTVEIVKNLNIGGYNDVGVPTKINWYRVNTRNDLYNGKPILVDKSIGGLEGGELYINDSVPNVRMVYKTADTTKTEVDPTLDEHLKLNVIGTPDTVYAFDAFLIVDNSGSTANDILIQFDTGGATILDFWSNVIGKNTTLNQIVNGISDSALITLNYSTESNFNIITLQGTMKVTTSGIFGLKWCEGHADTITVKKGSWLKLYGVV